MVLVGILDLLELRGLLERGRRLVRKGAQDLQPVGVGAQPVDRIVGPDVADPAGAAVVQRHEQPVVLPRVGPASVELRAIARLTVGQDLPSLLVREQEAALDLVLRPQQLLELVGCERGADVLAVPEPDRSSCAVVALVVQQLHGDLVEPERLRDGVAHLDEQHLRVPRLVQAGRDVEQTLERVAVRLRARRLLGGFDGDRGVLRDCDEDVDLVAARFAAGERLVDGEDPEQAPVAAAHRHEERVVGMPCAGVVAHLEVRRVHAAAVFVPVELARGNDVGAALQEALVEQRLPVVDLAHLAEERLARLFAAVDGADHEVVPFAAVEVDDHRPERERVGHRPRDRQEEVGQLVARPDEPRHLEQSAQPREDRRLTQIESRHRTSSIGCLEAAAVPRTRELRK